MCDEPRRENFSFRDWPRVVDATYGGGGRLCHFQKFECASQFGGIFGVTVAQTPEALDDLGNGISERTLRMKCNLNLLRAEC